MVRSMQPVTRVVIELAKSRVRLAFDSITLMPRCCASDGAFTMLTLSVTDSSRPLSTATVSGATFESAASPAYSISIWSIAPLQSWPWKRPSFSPSTR